jgi:phage terminase Nu1 subunit (DNA packaging protein)
MPLPFGEPTMMKSNDPLPETIDAAGLAALLELAPRTVRALGQAGILRRTGRGVFDLQKSVSGYVAYQAALAERGSGHAELCAAVLMLEQVLHVLRSSPDAAALAELADSIEHTLRIRASVMGVRPIPGVERLAL